MSDKSTAFGERGEWYVIAQFALLALILVAPFTAWHWRLIPSEEVGIVRFTGLILLLVGLGAANIGLLSLGWKNLTALPYPRPQAQFVGDNAYKLARHPIYTGLFLSAAGWSLLVNDLLSLLLTFVLLLLLDRKATREEAWLKAKYPQYAEYAAKTHKLIPWIY
jgi:protein-S-isoprenylcysteine O-methyltransferase Ste14